MLTIDKVHQNVLNVMRGFGNFETPPVLRFPTIPDPHVGSSVTRDCIMSITRGTGEWIKQIGSRHT